MRNIHRGATVLPSVRGSFLCALIERVGFICVHFYTISPAHCWCADLHRAVQHSFCPLLRYSEAGTKQSLVPCLSRAGAKGRTMCQEIFLLCFVFHPMPSCSGPSHKIDPRRIRIPSVRPKPFSCATKNHPLKLRTNTHRDVEKCLLAQQ